MTDPQLIPAFGYRENSHRRDDGTRYGPRRQT
jgi:hypothetical protein